jgi:superfamily II DNA helicase RecQ
MDESETIETDPKTH